MGCGMSTADKEAVHALCTAVSEGNISDVERLLGGGASAKGYGSTGHRGPHDTPLLAAAAFCAGHKTATDPAAASAILDATTSMVRQLCGAGADVNAMNTARASVFADLVHALPPPALLAELLASPSTTPDMGEGHCDVWYALAKGVPTSSGVPGDSRIHDLCRDLAQALVDGGVPPVADAKNTSVQRDPLAVTIANSCLPAVEVLLAAGAPVVGHKGVHSAAFIASKRRWTAPAAVGIDARILEALLAATPPTDAQSSVLRMKCTYAWMTSRPALLVALAAGLQTAGVALEPRHAAPEEWARVPHAQGDWSVHLGALVAVAAALLDETVHSEAAVRGLFPAHVEGGQPLHGLQDWFARKNGWKAAGGGKVLVGDLSGKDLTDLVLSAATHQPAFDALVTASPACAGVGQAVGGLAAVLLRTFHLQLDVEYTPEQRAVLSTLAGGEEGAAGDGAEEEKGEE